MGISFSYLKREDRLADPTGTFLTAVMPYAWPFTRPKSVFCSISDESPTYNTILQVKMVKK